MSTHQPFKADAYTIGRIVNALTSSSDGDLIFADTPNPDGVTLTQLLTNLVGTSIVFSNSGTFFTGLTNIEAALKHLNQFAYVKNTGRFIYVDPTIPDTKITEGEIYNYLGDAVAYADGLVYNGYNAVNILVMGSHTQVVTEITSDIGVHEITYSEAFTPIPLKKNGIRLIGIGNPVIRLKDFVGTSSEHVNLIEVDTDGVNNKINILVQDISFELVNCSYTNVFNIKNAPINNDVKERNGFKLENASISFYGGSHENNRLIDVSTSGTQLVSNVVINNLNVGSITETVASTTEIELIYVDHDDDTVVTINGLNFGLAASPNPLENTDDTKVTSFVGVKVLNGRVVINNSVLDEKFFWNGTSFTNVVTKFVKCYNSSVVAINNLGIVRNAFNMTEEDTGGLTTIQDWVSINNTAKLTVTGFDEVFSCDVQSQPTTSVGTSSVSSSGTIVDVKPVKSFWNGTNIAFGIGHKNELRLGQVSSADAAGFSSYNIDIYGIPFWYNSDSRSLQFFNGNEVSTVGKGKTYTTTLTSSSFSPTSYMFSGETTYLGFEATIIHNLDLTNRLAFTITVAETLTGRIIEPQEVVAETVNRIKLIMGNTGSYTVSIVGF